MYNKEMIKQELHLDVQQDVLGRLRTELEKIFLKDFPIEELILKSQKEKNGSQMIQFELLMARVKEEIKILKNYELACR